MRGSSLIEVIVSVSILSLIVTAIVGAIIFSQESQFSAGERARALAIAEEGLEAVRNIRDEKYSLLSDGVSGLGTTSARWNLSGLEDVIDNNFTRKIGLESVGLFRKKISATTTWQTSAGYTAEVSLITYLTDWRRRLAWVVPALESSFDLTAGNSGSAASDGLAIAYQSPYVYLTRVSSAGSEFYIIDVGNTAAPALTGQLSLNGNPNDLVVSGSFAYIASSDNAEELQVIDISVPGAPALAATFNLTNANSGNGVADGLAIAISGSTLYYGRAASAGVEFIVFDVAVPTSPLILGTLALNGDPNDMRVSLANVFIVSSDNASEFQIIDAAVPALPVLLSSLDLVSGSATADGLSISLGTNTAYVGRQGSGAPEFYVIDTTVPSTPTLSGTLEIGADVRSLDFSPDYNFAFAATGDTANDFTSINVATPAAPVILGQLDLGDGPADLVYNFALDRNFIASSFNTGELQVVAPQ